MTEPNSEPNSVPDSDPKPDPKSDPNPDPKTDLNLASQSALTASFKNGIILGCFALVSTGLIAITHSLTKDKINQVIEASLIKQFDQLIDPKLYDNEPYSDCTLVSNRQLLGQEQTKIYRMRAAHTNVALLLTSAAPDGYAGKISLAVAVYTNGTLAGVRVTDHQETPGLGDKIEMSKSDWIEQFTGKSLTNLTQAKWNVVKDGGSFDSLTGATITPRAIIQSVYKSLLFVEQNKTILFNAESNCG